MDVFHIFVCHKIFKAEFLDSEIKNSLFSYFSEI